MSYSSSRYVRYTVAVIALLLATLPDTALADHDAATLYVNGAWAGLAAGTDPDDGGPATAIGTDAFATIGGAVAVALAGDVVIVAQGDYAEALTLSRAITLRSADAAHKAVITGSGTRTTIAASDVTIQDIVYDLTGDTSTDGVIVVNRGGSWPTFAIDHGQITFDGIEVYGGRRAMYLTVADATIRDSHFASQARDAIFFNAASGTTTIAGNIFTGAASSKALVFENFSSGDPAVSGTIIVTNNTVSGKNNFLVYNQWQTPSAGVSLTITGNVIAPFGTAISIYDPGSGFDPANFAKIASLTVTGNRFSDPAQQALALPAVGMTATVDATRNWWGAATGPTHAMNPGGAGARLAPNATFAPWCMTSACTAFAGIATRLHFTAQPTTAVAGQVLHVEPVVRAEDPDGNLGINFAGSVTLTLSGPSASAVLAGTRTATAVAGVATFPGLSIAPPGTGYRLTASASGLAATEGNVFTVTAPPPPPAPAPTVAPPAATATPAPVPTPTPKLTTTASPTALTAVVSEDGTVAVAVPAGAVASETTFSVGVLDETPADAPLPAGIARLGTQTFVFTAADTVTGEAVTQFSAPITLTFQIEPEEVTAAGSDEIVVAFWNGSEWVTLLTSVDSLTGEVSARTDHFTTFAVLRVSRLTLTLRPGWNGIVYTGPSDLTVEAAADAIGPGLRAIWRIDADGSWRRYAPAAPALANDLHTLNSRDALFVQIGDSAAASWSMPDVIPPPDGTRTLTIAGERRLIGYTGPDGLAIEEALAGAVPAGVRAAWRWDAPRGTWQWYIVGAPAHVNTLTSLTRLDALYLVLDEPVTLTLPESN